MKIKAIKRFFLNLQFIFRPSYWLMNDPYSQAWDIILNKALDSLEFTKIDRHTASLGDLRIWIANHPYGSFTNYSNESRFGSYRPSRLTILKARKKLMEHYNSDPYYRLFD